ncbi:MAG TPA: protein-disulfide reductase DsbD domain-containing protein [Bryobacteraceae bacterium]|nr:protein-disulfide reductase DsbD domain-containing protein [Bryobacteraceae bacterium]
MTLCNCSTRLAAAFALLLASALSPSLPAQTSNVLSVTPDRLTIKRNAEGDVKLKAQLRAGFHVNSDKPSEEYLIPLKLSWAKEPLQLEQITYPKPQMEKYDFSPTPLSVFSGNFEIVARFKAPASAAPGPAMMNGKLRYQACNNKECLPPKTIDVAVTVDIQ